MSFHAGTGEGSFDGKDIRLPPGMAAAADIKTGTRKLSLLMRMGDEAGRER